LITLFGENIMKTAQRIKKKWMKRKIIKREKAWVRRMALLSICVGMLGAQGCACMFGAARGGYEGIRRDIEAMRSVSAPGSPATHYGYELPGPPPYGKGVSE
jgi:hypothetical protein